MTPFIPTRRDVYLVRTELFSHKLPIELILDILDYARYWVEGVHEITDFKVLLDEEFDTDYTEAYPYLGVNALPVERPFSSSGAEPPKIKEIEFLVVSHDQGWTTEDTKGTFLTSSWFEASILTPKRSIRTGMMITNDDDHRRAFYRNRQSYSNVKTAVQTMFGDMLRLVPRPTSDLEPQRLHCTEMMHINTQAESTDEITRDHTTDLQTASTKEGQHAWYLQGNEVARGSSVFHGEMVRRYNVVWGSKSCPRWVGNEGSGNGDGFVDTIKKGDWIVVWARAKRRGWENHVHGVRMIIRYHL